MKKTRTAPISDPAGWYSRDLLENEDWIYHLTEKEKTELLDAVATSQEIALLNITLADFPLPNLAAQLHSIA